MTQFAFPQLLTPNTQLPAADPVLTTVCACQKAVIALDIGKIGTASATEPAQKQRLTKAKLTKLSFAIRGALRDQPPDMRKAYLKLFMDNVIISKEEIRVSGPKGLLAKAAMSDLPPEYSGENYYFYSRMVCQMPRK